MIHRFEPSFFTWLKESNLFFWTTQRIELFLKICSKKLIFSIWFTELNLFSALLQECNLFFLTWLKELNHLFEYARERHCQSRPSLSLDSNTWEPFWKILTRRIELFFSMTQRIEPFEQEPSFFKKWPSRIEPFEKYDSNNWSFFSMTQRIEPFSFSVWLTELNPFVKYESTNWSLLKIWLKRFVFFFSKIKLKDLNFIDFFLSMTQRKLNLSIKIFKNWTFFLEKIWLKYFWVWLKEMNFFEYHSKNWTFFLEWKYDSKNWIWLKGLNLYFSNMTQSLEPF